MDNFLGAVVLVLAALVGSAILLITWLFFQHSVVYPLRYERFQSEVAEWNQQHWENGHALKVDVEVTSTTEFGTETAGVTRTCYEKRYARAGGIKGPPAKFDVTYSGGPAFLTVSFGPEAMHKTHLREVCWDALSDGENWTLPHVTESPHYWSDIVANDLSFRCFLGSDPRTTRGRVTRPTFIGIERLPLHELIDRGEYMALTERSDGSARHELDIYHSQPGEPKWCRGGSEAHCDPEVERICGRTLH